MTLSADPYVWIAAIMTLCVFSFLYRDNVVFALVEHVLVGLAAGYVFVTTWQNVFLSELIDPLLKGGLGSEAHLWVALFLCLLWAGKYFKKTKDLYRLALAFFVAVDLGLTVPTYMESNVLEQIAGTVNVSFSGAIDTVVGNAVLIIGTITALVFFFFSKPHTGVIGGAARIGSWILMVGFGATFSYTILSRIYLLAGRLLFLFRDWLGIMG